MYTEVKRIKLVLLQALEPSVRDLSVPFGEMLIHLFARLHAHTSLHFFACSLIHLALCSQIRWNIQLTKEFIGPDKSNTAMKLENPTSLYPKSFPITEKLCIKSPSELGTGLHTYRPHGVAHGEKSVPQHCFWPHSGRSHHPDCAAGSL